MKQFLAPFIVALSVISLSACSSTTDDTGNITGSGNTSGYGNNIQTNDLTQLQDQFRTQVSDRVYFQTNSTSLDSESRRTLDGQAMFLKDHPSLILTIEGHCDERGTREYNLALGERRAQSAKDYLMTHGISGQRITVVSYGKERPEAPGSNSAAWAQNRRGTSVLY